MKAMEWTNIDRKDWPAGGWDGEPDAAQWTDEATGLPCLAKRHKRSGHWCGYVGVAEGHPAYEKGYSDEDLNPEVHGGLTFASFCDGEPGTGICHLAEPGEPDRVWWLGFDCAHSGDWSPQDAMYERDRPEACWKRFGEDTYKSLQYVKNQCGELAAQLKAMS